MKKPQDEKDVVRNFISWALENILKLLKVHTVPMQVIALCFALHFTVSQCLSGGICTIQLAKCNCRTNIFAVTFYALDTSEISGCSLAHW